MLSGMNRSRTQAGVAEDVDALVARASAAQQEFEGWPEPRVDALLEDIAQVIADKAEELALATVLETGYGNVSDKTFKNRFASKWVYRSLAGRPGTGLLRFDAARNIAEITSPVGVVFGLIPKTNPVSTVLFKVLIALKSRNALILSSHRDAQDVGNQVGELIAAVLEKHHAPPGSVQWLQRRPDRVER
jgi:acyl-CoA reductase-like NAD-dependent aldehyde dehydrogenase